MRRASAEGIWTQTVAAMQPLDGPLMQRYCRLAAQHQLWLSLGGFQACLTSGSTACPLTSACMTCQAAQAFPWWCNRAAAVRIPSNNARDDFVAGSDVRCEHAACIVVLTWVGSSVLTSSSPPLPVCTPCSSIVRTGPPTPTVHCKWSRSSSTRVTRHQPGGCLQETGPDPEHLYNCHVVVTSEGKIAARYRKVHLFNVEVQNGPVLMESRSTAPGNEVEPMHVHHTAPIIMLMALLLGAQSALVLICNMWCAPAMSVHQTFVGPD